MRAIRRPASGDWGCVSTGTTAQSAETARSGSPVRLRRPPQRAGGRRWCSLESRRLIALHLKGEGAAGRAISADGMILIELTVPFPKTSRAAFTGGLPRWGGRIIGRLCVTVERTPTQGEGQGSDQGFYHVSLLSFGG